MYCEPIRTETTVEVDEELKPEGADMPSFVVAAASNPESQGPLLSLVPPVCVSADQSGTSNGIAAKAAPAQIRESSSVMDAPGAAEPTGALPSFAVAPGAAMPARGKLDWLSEAGWRISMSSLALSSILSYFCLHSLTGLYYWQSTGIQRDFYMHASHDASAIGVLTTLLCTVAYFKGFIGIKAGKGTWIVRGLLALAGISLGTLFGGLTGALTACGIAAAFIGLHWLGGQVHQAMPTTFRFKRALMLNGLVCMPYALFVFWSIFIYHRPYSADYSSAYTDFNSSFVYVLFFVMSLTIGAGTYAVARTARTSEARPLILLGILQQSPLLIGFLAQVIAMGTLGDAVPFVLSGLGTLVSVMLLIGFSASAAAGINGLKHRRKIEKSGGYIF